MPYKRKPPRVVRTSTKATRIAADAGQLESIRKRVLADLKTPKGLRLDNLRKFGGNPKHTRRR